MMQSSPRKFPNCLVSPCPPLPAGSKSVQASLLLLFLSYSEWNTVIGTVLWLIHIKVLLRHKEPKGISLYLYGIKVVGAGVSNPIHNRVFLEPRALHSALLTVKMEDHRNLLAGRGGRDRNLGSPGGEKYEKYFWQKDKMNTWVQAESRQRDDQLHT